VSTLLKKLL